MSGDNENLLKLLRQQFSKEFALLIEGFYLALPELTLPETREEGIRKIFRAIHAIKGSPRAVGYEEIGDIAHALENCLALVRVYPERIDQAFIDCMIDTIQTIDQYIANPLINILSLGVALESEYRRLEGPTSITSARSPLNINQHEINSYQIGPNQKLGTFELIIERAKRVALESATDLKKELDFFGFGGQVGAPEDILLRIADPILHLVRNAVDHGIESVDRRLATWKSGVGRIMLKISIHSNKLVIAVLDDGAGIKRDAIISKCVLEGVFSDERAAQNLSDAEVFSHLCRPGFSTKNAVTQISGRGVGLDIVKDTVEKLGGALEISSKPGKGSCFKITLPITVDQSK